MFLVQILKTTLAFFSHLSQPDNKNIYFLILQTNTKTQLSDTYTTKRA